MAPIATTEDDPLVNRTQKLQLTKRATTNDSPASRSFACYPVVELVCSYLDLNDIDALARTCRQIHANLLQFRPDVMKLSLQCMNSTMAVSNCRNSNLSTSWYDRAYMHIGQCKRGECARDLVMRCKKTGCKVVACRNCIISSVPNNATLHRRLRRLCVDCCEANLESLITPFSVNAGCYSQNELCSCTSLIGLCEFCGFSHRSKDDKYFALVYEQIKCLMIDIGGLVKCPRKSKCVAAVSKHDPPDAPDAYDESSGVRGLVYGGNYLGGDVVSDEELARRLDVGVEVGDVHREEKRGIYRAWCAWCQKIVPSEDDKKRYGII